MRNPRSATRRSATWSSAALGALLALTGTTVPACVDIEEVGGPGTCVALADCAEVPGLRSCDAGQCVAPAAAPACATDTDCSIFASARCDAGVCARPCATDIECAAGGTCAGGICLPAGVGCSHSAQCVDRGPNFVCRELRCVSLTSDLCTTVHTTEANPADAYLDDDALFFGSILPTVGPDAAYGTLLEDAIKLAIDDFAKVGGLPSPTGGASRPIVLVGCSDGAEEDRGIEAAHHLVKDLGVPAIVGDAFSGNTIKLASEVTIPAGVLLFSPSATNPAITNLADQDLVWRTSPPDTLQATALARYYPDVEARARARYPMIPPGSIKVAVVHSSDPYGAALADALESQLVFNGMPAAAQANGNYKRLDYGDPGNPDLSVVPSAVSFAPHVVFVFGFNEGVDPVFESIETQWKVPGDGHRPMWVFSDGGQVPELWSEAIASEDLRTRVTGSVPGAGPSATAFATFRTRWLASPYSLGGSRSPDTLGPAGAYDITYMLAYSAVAVRQDPMTGANLVKDGLRKMVPGANVPKVNVGPAAISATFAELTAGQPIDIEGASGPLDFDAHGEAASDIQIWCVPKGAGTAVAGAAIHSGRYWDSAEQKMAGAISPDCALP